MKCSGLCAAVPLIMLLFCAEVGGQALDEAFLRSTVLIVCDRAPSSVSRGTGFFVSRSVGPDRCQVFLVTNQHVLPPEGTTDTISVRVTVGAEGVGGVRFVKISVLGTDGKYLPNVRIHKTPGFDVAAVNVTDLINRERIQAAWLPLNLLATHERLRSENITVGDEVFLLGYPAAIHDERNTMPILRTGVIATVPTAGFACNSDLRQKGLPDRIDGFLVDANVFPGSSGSVVIMKPQATTIGIDGATVVSAAKKIPYVLGIVSGSIPINDSALGTVQRMGLGVVFGHDAIRSVIEQFP